MKKIKFSENVEFLLKRAKSLGIETEIIGEDIPVLIAGHGGKSVAMYRGRIPLNSSGAAKISKDKTLTKSILSHLKINVPKGFQVQDIEKIEADIKKHNLKYPLVVKPNDEALGNGVIADIEDLDGVLRAIYELNNNFSSLVIEEYFEGEDP